MNQKLSVKSILLVAAFGCMSFTVYAADDTAPANKDRRQEILKRFDANGDGKLDATEREAAKAAMPERRGDGPKDGVAGKIRERAKDRLDTDGDGKISESERAAMRAEIVNRPRAMARVDTDGDGQISDTEWAAAREQMRDRMGPGGPGGPGKGPGKGKGAEGGR